MAEKKRKWTPRARDYVLEAKNLAVPMKASKVHPLLSQAQKKQQGKEEPVADPKAAEKPKSVDPLRSGGGAKAAIPNPLGPLGPLGGGGGGSSSEAAGSSGSVDPLAKKGGATGTQPFELWPDKTVRILSRYTTNKKIAVTANFIEDNEDLAKNPKAVEQTASRLAELETNPETVEQKNFMTQKEYITHIEEQHERLKAAWDAGERVVSLKIAIQCAKLLGDTTVPQFYPSMYVLLTAILDTFGELVFDRIKLRGMETPNSSAPPTVLPAGFSETLVCSSAKETCRNWFFKTACIRELIPRLYIDMALIKSYRFLMDNSFPEILSRLGRAMRGIGDALAATYARAYLTHKVNYITNSYHEAYTVYRPPPDAHKKVVLEAFDDFMFTFKTLKADGWKGVIHISSERITVDDYIDLYNPALEWLMQNIGWNATEDLFFALLQQYRDYCNDSTVLFHIISAFKPSLSASHAQGIVTLIKECEENSHTPKSKLYLALGRCLIQCAPPKSQRLPILNDIWKVVTKIENPEEYMDIAVVFVQYLLLHFTDREVNIFLKDVIKHVKKDQAYARLQDQLALVVQKTMEHTTSLENTLAMDNFLPIVDLLDKAGKVVAGKVILKAFANTTMQSTSDPVIIHTLFDVGRTLHDFIDSMTFEDERRQISDHIVSFIRKVDFGRDLEKQLNFYVDARQAFTSLDAVTTELVLRVALLASRAHKFMKGKHTKKTANFVKACLAYCHITIPSLEDPFARLRLLLQCGEVSLVNQMIVQGEGFLKAAISLIPEVPATIEDPVTKKIMSSETELVSFLRNFTAFLLLMPGHPEKGPFYLIKGLLNATQAYEPWKTGSSEGKTRVYIGVLALFCTYYQATFPYHIDRVESNDVLYGGKEDYLAEVDTFIDTLITSVLQQLTEIGQKGDLLSRKQQGTLAIEMVNLLVNFLELNNASATLIVKLYQLASKNNAVDPSFLAGTLAHIKSKKGTWYQDVANKIAGNA